MKVRKLLASLLSAAMILGTMSFPTFAEENYEASVNDQPYDTLVDAVAAAQDGDTIKLLSDVTTSEKTSGMVWFLGKNGNFNFDCNGHTLTGGITDSYFASDNANITIKNGKVDTTFYILPDGQYVQQAAIWAQNNTITVEGGEFSATNAVVMQYGGTVEIKNGTYIMKEDDGAVILSMGGEVTIQDGTFKCDEGVEACAIAAVENGLVNVYGGTFDGYLDVLNNGKINIYGGTFSVDPTDYVADGYEAIENGDGTWSVYEEILNPVAKIGGRKYATFADALAAAQDGNVIDLLDNTVNLDGTQNTIDKNITFTNGTFDITGAVCLANGIFDVTASDAKFENVNFIGDGYSSAYGVIYVHNGGQVTLDNCNMNLANEQFAGSAPVRGNGVTDTIKVVGGTWNLENTSSVIKQATVDIDRLTVNAAITDPTLVEGKLRNHGFRMIAGTIKNSNIVANGFETAIKNDVGELTLDHTTLESDKTVFIKSGAKLLGVNGSAVTADIDVAANSVVNSINLTGDVTAADTADLRYNYYANGVPSNGVIYPYFEDAAMTKLVVGAASATDAEMKEVVEETVTNIELSKVTADNLAETVKELNSEVQKDISAEVVEKIINAQNTNTETTTSAAFSMDSEISATVEEKTETNDVNVVLTSGNNKVYNVTATENNVVVNETSTPVLIKIKTDDIITKVLHEHNGVVKELPFTQANGYVMFTMNEFSNVALVSAIPVSSGQAKLSFVPQTSQPEGKAVYDVVLTGDTFETVKNFVSGDFVTSLVGTGSTPFEYVITPKNGEIDVYYDTNADGTRKYHVNLDHFDVNTSYTTSVDGTHANSVVIGTMTVEGYGAGSIVVSNMQMNKHDGTAENLAKEIATIAGDPAIFNIAVPTRALTINVNFPNAVNNNAKAYQDMKVEISGGDLAAPITKELGNNVQGVRWNNNEYTTTISNELTLDNTYTVTVSGAGYRTARYTVTMTEDKVLNFWNNVKNTAEVVEVGSDLSKAKNVTFLAGELVRDNQINIYDLSAVVSYFGRNNSVDAYSAYAKYDLNRDGKIDSKDVAYVLVSWGK